MLEPHFIDVLILGLSQEDGDSHYRGLKDADVT